MSEARLARTREAYLDKKADTLGVEGNTRYRTGRALEYKVVKEWKAKDYHVVRSAGSHGLYDVYAWRPDRPSEFIQCKRVMKRAEGERLIRKFKESPPTIPSSYYHQHLVVYVKETRETLTTVV